MRSSRLAPLLLALPLLLPGTAALSAAVRIDAGFAEPPPGARLRAYWWWLNGNVTSNAITRDLEQMKAKGFGGALICDAGGAEQDGNDRVPHGPDFFSPEWRALYRHALHEAHRLGLEMSLNIQSGWNLGGPMVKPEDAAQKLVWSEARFTGPGKPGKPLPEPKSRDNFYRDLFVVAYPVATPRSGSAIPEPSLNVSSHQSAHPPAAVADGNPATFWVSEGTEAGKGPTADKPEWLQLSLSRNVTVERLSLQGRPGYGPRDCELRVSTDGQQFSTVRKFSVNQDGKAAITFPAQNAKVFRLVILSAYDPRSTERGARNVQIAELGFSGPGFTWPSGSARRPLQNWEQKAMHRALYFSAPDTTPLFAEFPETPGEEDTRAAAVVDLTGKIAADGTLDWEVPPGEWQVLRFGHTIGDHSRVSTSSDGWKGYALDVLDAGALNRYWDAVVDPLIDDAGRLAGTTLKYLHTDSWEVEAINWTPTLRQAFRKRRGYDFLPYLPAITGRVVDSRRASNRFLHDFRKTLGDLAVDHHFRIFRDRAHQRGLLIHPESGGPHAVPIDAQRCLGWNDAPMSEFWAWSWRHRVGDDNRFFVKQPASAAHTYGRKLVLAEGFTTIGPHWQETIWDNLKPSFDKAVCEGLNLLVWHAFVCSPDEMGLPGQQYFAGTHFNPNTTWWDKSGPFLNYINRVQFLMQEGRFIADACYYYGDHVPNFSQRKHSDPAGLLPGYDYDVVTEEVILTRMTVRNGRLVLPDGMNYRLMVLPNRDMISLPVLQKLRQLVANGATILGPKPSQASSLRDFPKNDAAVAEIADELWGAGEASATVRKYKKGRVISGRTAREVLLSDGVPPDFEFARIQPSNEPEPASTQIDYIHRRIGDVEVYFVMNRTNTWEQLNCSFRVSGKAPEFWNAVTGEKRFATTWSERDGRTILPLEFSPCGSWIVVFRAPAAKHRPTGAPNHRTFQPVATLQGPWSVHFDPRWKAPGSIQFDQLISWTDHTEPAIKHYSGTAVYRQTFDLPAGSSEPLWLDLGDLRELAEVRLNGHSLGILWSPPFRVKLTGAKPSGNLLEVEIVNFWPNRLIGDTSLPPHQRLTQTNIRKFTPDTPLMRSGLFGPVQLLRSSW